MSEQPTNGFESTPHNDDELDDFSLEILREEAERRKASKQQEPSLVFEKSTINIPEKSPAQPEAVAITLEAAHISQGLQSKQKPRNEDMVLRRDTLGLFGVFDGMGGYDNGDRASWAAADAVRRYYSTQTEPPSSREEALDNIKAAMDAARIGVIRYGGAGGTTAVFGKIENIEGKPYLVWANAGDSRLFMQEEMDGPIIPISTDQSHGRYVFNGLYGRPTIRSTVSDEFGIIPLEPGARIMFCSDGITGDTPEQALSDAEFDWAFDAPNPKEAANRLVAASKKRDDKSVLIIDVHDDEERRTGQKDWPGVGAPPAAMNAPLPLYAPPESLRQRMAWRFRRVKEALKAVPAAVGAAAMDRYDRTQDYFHEPDKGKNRRRVVVAAAIGVVALAAAYKLGAFDSIFVGNPHPSSPTGTQPPIKPPSPGGAPESVVPPSRAPTPPEATQTSAIRLSQGGTIWGQSAEYLQSHGIEPTNANVDLVKDAVLQHQGLSEFDATQLPVGYRFTIPPEVLERLGGAK